MPCDSDFRRRLRDNAPALDRGMSGAGRPGAVTRGRVSHTGLVMTLD